VQLDVTFPGLPCSWGQIDVMDVSGELELDVDHDLFKKRLSADGTPLDDGEKHQVADTYNCMLLEHDALTL
jgi:endoplasmic reticulum-Golgi intermediate compartment protein 3